MRFKGIEDKKPDKTLLTEYRLVFKSDAGQKVLADILVNHCWFMGYIPPGDDKAVGEHNVGVAILSRLGYSEKEKQAIIRAILNVAVED